MYTCDWCGTEGIHVQLMCMCKFPGDTVTKAFCSIPCQRYIEAQFFGEPEPMPLKCDECGVEGMHVAEHHFFLKGEWKFNACGDECSDKIIDSAYKIALPSAIKVENAHVSTF